MSIPSPTRTFFAWLKPKWSVIAIVPGEAISATQLQTGFH